MQISIGSRIQGFIKILGIDNFPFTNSTLKSHFRIKIKDHHEDVSNDSNAKSKSQKIITVYNELKNLALSDAKEADSESISNA